MKKFLVTISTLLSIGLLIGAVTIISEFGGLNTDDNPIFLKNQTPDSENVLTDVGYGLKPRSGYLVFSTEPSRNLYAFYTSGGNKYLVCQSSGQLKATLGGASFDISIGTVSTTVNTSLAALGDKLFYTNTVDGLKVWDTSIVEVVTGSYKAAHIVSHKGRIWMAGLSNDRRTIYISEYLDGTNFTLVATDIAVNTDPSRLQIQGALDDVITGLYASYNDMVIWFKNRSFGGCIGSRRDNFVSREYSNSIGCNYPDTVMNCDGVLRWLGNNRVVYEFDGARYYPINTDIDEYMATVIQGDLNQRQWVQTTQGDWLAGTIGVGLDTTTSSGDLIFASQPNSTLSRNSAADWNLGTIGVGLDTTSVSGDILLPRSTTSVSVFWATGTIRSGLNTDSTFVNNSTAMRGAFALMFIPTCTMPLDKVTMSFAYKSGAVEGYQSWVTLHSGATCPSAVVLDTSTNRIQENTVSTNTWVLTTKTTNYYFSQSTTTDKRLSAGNTYWFVMHATITSVNTTLQSSTFTWIYFSNGFNNAGSKQYFIVPPGVSSITADVSGAAGGTGGVAPQWGVPGRGGQISSSFTVTQHSSVCVKVGYTGCVGTEGGGGPTAGGGASEIRIGGNLLANRVLIAGGGGGAGYDFLSGFGGAGNGGSGGITGASGSDTGPYRKGFGATISSAGLGGEGSGIYWGGDGAVNASGGYGGACGCSTNGQGGGGGGYNGGGGGGADSCPTFHFAGGGGGASWSACPVYGYADASNYGQGSATITYTAHTEFYAYEITTALSSTSLLYTSSWTTSGSDYRAGSYDSPFQVYFATSVFNSTYTTNVHDAGLDFSESNTVSKWLSFDISESTNDGTISYGLYVDNDTNIDIYDPSTYVSSQVLTNGLIPTIAKNRYLTVSAKFSRNLSTYTPTIHSFTLNYSTAIMSSTFTSRTYDAGTKFSEWSSFGIDETLNNGTISFYLYSSTNSSINRFDPSTYSSSQTITDGAIPSITVQRYVAVSADFSRSYSTYTPTIHSFTVNFNEGSSLRSFGQYISQRYWLAVAVSSTSNNKVLVYDRNKQWQRYSNINISGIINYSGTFYFGNGNGIFQLEYGHDDNGSPISSYYKTKTYAVAGFDTYSTFRDLWLATENSNLTLTTEYYVDGYDSALSLSTFTLNSQLGYQSFRLPFKDAELKQGKYISVKWTISSLYDWRILNANLYYDPEAEPSEEAR